MNRFKTKPTFCPLIRANHSAELDIAYVELSHTVHPRHLNLHADRAPSKLVAIVKLFIIFCSYHE